MVVMQQPSRIFAVCVVLLALCVGSRSVGCASLNEHGAGASTQRQKFSGGFPGITKAAQQMLSQGNSSFVTAAATAAGVQMMKRAISGLDLREKVETAIQNIKATHTRQSASTAQQPFNAIRQDLQDMLTQGEQWVGGFKAGSAVDKSQTDAKWLASDWLELRETLSIPAGWSAIAKDFNQRATHVQSQVQQNIDGLSSSIEGYLEESKRIVGDTLKRSLSFDAKLLDGANTWPAKSTPGGGLWDVWLAEGGVLEKWMQHGTDARNRIKNHFVSRFEQVKARVDAVRQAADNSKGGDSKRARLAEAEVASQNNQLVTRLLTVMEGGEWEHVLARDGVNVYRKQMLDANGQGSKFYCIKAVSTIDARATDIYELLKDPQRISEYNDECADAEELPPLSSDTRLTWASSKKYGPFKPRDFITRTHHRQMKDGTLIVMSQSEDVDFQRSGKDAYVRTEVLLAGNVMRENPSDPSKTDFVTIAHINPGGAAETPLGAKIVNHLCTHGPVNFILKLESAAGKQPMQEP